MIIALDTNVISELMNEGINSNVARWINTHGSDVIITTITVAEVRYGLLRMPQGKRRTILETEFNRLTAKFRDVILPFNTAAAEISADIRAQQASYGRTLPFTDSLIAATCLAHGAALATRNTKDFEDLGLEVINPFEDA